MHCDLLISVVASGKVARFTAKCRVETPDVAYVLRQSELNAVGDQVPLAMPRPVSQKGYLFGRRFPLRSIPFRISCVRGVEANRLLLQRFRAPR